MNKDFKRIIFIGLGYIGLPSAAVISSKGMNVLGVDTNIDVVNTINSGNIHIKEPFLEDLVKEQVAGGRLKASSSPNSADVFILAVPTPFDKNMMPNISMVVSATKAAIPFLREGNLFIIESTCPVGTTKKVSDIIFSERPELKGKIYISYCPERVLPGNIISEIVNNDRIVGGIDKDSATLAKDFYKTFVNGSIYKTNSETAELCKLTENSYRDVQIAFANQLSILADSIEINVWELIELANKHPRINILNPGCGVGGHCIAVDPWFLISSYPESTKLIKDARVINENKSSWCIEKAEKKIKLMHKEKKQRIKIACMGLAFKPDIDDLRESPALKIATSISKLDEAEVLFVEPNIKKVDGIELIDYEDAYNSADLVLWLVAHTAFNQIKNINTKQEIDFCGISQNI